jgi:peptide/nickel transport system permease protein
MGTARFIVRRLLLGVFVMWVVSVGTFFLFYVIPTDPAKLLAGKLANATAIADIRERLGLNRPPIVQYWHYLNGLLHGSLGTSYYNGGVAVTTLVKEDLPPTISLAVGGAILFVVVGIAVGILSAIRARTLTDRAATAFVLAGVSFPTFVVGLLLLFVVFLQFSKIGIVWFQPGYIPFAQSPTEWLGRMILPWITLATVQAAVYSRLMRGSMLEALGEDYIRTARAKGLTERRVVYRHALRAALTPVVSQLGVDIGTLLGGAVVTETVFGLGGIGQASVTAILNGDAPVVLGVVLMAALFVVVANLIVDILYSVLDPRVKLA